MIRKAVKVAKIPVFATFWIAVAGVVYLHMLARPFRDRPVSDVIH